MRTIQERYLLETLLFTLEKYHVLEAEGNSVAQFAKRPCTWCDGFGYEHVTSGEYEHAQQCCCERCVVGAFVERLPNDMVQTVCPVCEGTRQMVIELTSLQQLAEAAE